MSAEKSRQEAIRWLNTARGDLKTSEVLLASQRYAHACFHAQQSAEKALKALWYAGGGDPWGHSVSRLVDNLSEVDSAVHAQVASLSRDAALLDRFYIPTRYPNGLPDITPEQAYFEEDAREAGGIAKRILGQVTDLISG